MKAHVIWKLSEDSANDISIPSNVHTFQWLPQYDLMADRRTRLFVTHAGSNSTREAIYHGVPGVANPIFLDQFGNAQKLVHRAKMGVSLDYKSFTEYGFAQALQEALDHLYPASALALTWYQYHMFDIYVSLSVLISTLVICPCCWLVRGLIFCSARKVMKAKSE